MANGVAALQLVSPEPAPQAPGDRIGIAMADAMAAVCAGYLEWSGSGLTAPTKALGAERVASLYLLFKEASGPDFATARTECWRVLREGHGADLPAALTNMIIDEL